MIGTEADSFSQKEKSMTTGQNKMMFRFYFEGNKLPFDRFDMADALFNEKRLDISLCVDLAENHDERKLEKILPNGLESSCLLELGVNEIKKEGHLLWRIKGYYLEAKTRKTRGLFVGLISFTGMPRSYIDLEVEV